MSVGILSKRYARALLQIGVERQLLERFRQELGQVVQVFHLEKRFLLLLESPSLDAARKDALLADLMKYLGLSTEIKNFLGVLRDKGRIRLLPQIARAFGVLADEASAIQRVSVYSAVKLEEHQRLALQKALETRQGRSIVLTEHSDPTLIGGMRIEMNGQILDGTVRTQLKRMAEIITEGR